MEKRLVIFMLLSMLIFLGFAITKSVLMPPDPEALQKAKQAQQAKQDVPPGEAAQPDEAAAVAEADGKKAEADPLAAPKEPEQPNVNAGAPAGEAPTDDVEPPTWTTLGSFAADSPYRLLVTFTNRGAAVDRVELVERRSNGKLRYRDLTKTFGYLGAQYHDTGEGCQVKAVGDGTPAAMATADVDGGIQVGDVIVNAADSAIDRAADLDAVLAKHEPDQILKLTVRRGSGGDSQRIDFQATLATRPLELIQSEGGPGVGPVPSFLTGIHSIGGQEARFQDIELSGVTSLRNSTWQVEKNESEVIFRKTVSLGEEADAVKLEFVKRYRFAQVPADQITDHDYPGYHVQMDVEIWNRGSAAEQVAYRLDGPTGLPLEGWWFSYKTHPSWGSAGARDVVWRVHDRKESLRSPSQIQKEVKKQPDDPVKSLLTDKPTLGDRTLDYLGVDTQYFSAVMLAGEEQKPGTIVCQQAYSLPIGDVEKLTGKEIRTVNATYRMVSEGAKIEPGESVTHQYHLFLGPKSTKLMDKYGISSIIEYGWFGFVARPLSRVLHFFYGITWNYGLAIILLTVLVRGCMFPVGRKAARNAQMMQELAPEIKKIKEKYKNDMEKQAQAQRELWKKHNFNPLGGCWLMFLQLPIFIGLYRCLSVDIELRQAPLIPGVQWCSNLAAPDMFLYWDNPSLQFLTGTTGWLGPYLNVLPIVTIVLFIVQQKLFTPPATDDQTMMQQRMMKFMMIFMGVLFFKVPAGLCIYFIASSIWGIAERKLLPKPNLTKPAETSSVVGKLLRKAESDAPNSARARRKRRR